MAVKAVKAVFLLSCGRAKIEVFKNADITSSLIYHISKHALCSLRISQGHFAYLFSFVEVRNVEHRYRKLNLIIAHRILNVRTFSRGRRYLSKHFPCECRTFLYGKKSVFKTTWILGRNQGSVYMITPCQDIPPSRDTPTSCKNNQFLLCFYMRFYHIPSCRDVFISSLHGGISHLGGIKLTSIRMP